MKEKCVMERNDKCFCGSGKKYKKCHYRINSESRLAKMYQANFALDEYCRKHDLVNNCPSGCCRCCTNNFKISENEFLMILEKLSYEHRDIELYIGKSLKVAELVELGYKLSDMANCIFLDNNGRCEVYDVRPRVCRTFGSTEGCLIINHYYNLELPEIQNLTKTHDTCIPYTERRFPIRKSIYLWFYDLKDDEVRDRAYKSMGIIRNCSDEEYYNYLRKSNRLEDSGSLL
ncbi:MAG: SEC-C domain-containing protein [Parabacteroides gordonii]|nr:SEC-C domain-containing protein [Parabacteroides gordonii]